MAGGPQSDYSDDLKLGELETREKGSTTLSRCAVHRQAWGRAQNGRHEEREGALVLAPATPKEGSQVNAVLMEKA